MRDGELAGSRTYIDKTLGATDNSQVKRGARIADKLAVTRPLCFSFI